MFKWNTDKIIADLTQNACVRSISNNGPGGDVDTDNLTITLHGTQGKLYVCGFSVDTDITDPANCKVEAIELTDTHGFGLQSKDYVVALSFITIRQYFIQQKADVVNSLKDYF